MPRGYDRALYILPFDHRGSFQTKMVGCGAPKKATREVAVGEIARRYREFRRHFRNRRVPDEGLIARIGI
jgi:hypothetical protein